MYDWAETLHVSMEENVIDENKHDVPTIRRNSINYFCLDLHNMHQFETLHIVHVFDINIMWAVVNKQRAYKLFSFLEI